MSGMSTLGKVAKSGQAEQKSNRHDTSIQIGTCSLYVWVKEQKMKV